MFSSFGYTKVPSNAAIGTINEEIALRDKGIKVWIARETAKNPGVRQFSVEQYESPFATKKYFLIICAFTLLICIVGGVTLKFFGPFQVERYMHYPASNCTIDSISHTTDSHGNIMYAVYVNYTDSNNQTHDNIIRVSYNTFYARNWTIGSVFKCVYKGSFVLDYQTLETDHSRAEKYWWIGFLVPIPVSLYALLMLFILKLVYGTGSIAFYPRNVTFGNDLVIDRWASIPSHLQQFFYVLLMTYYNSENPTMYPTARTIAFHKSTNSNITMTKGLLLFLVFFTFVISCGMLVFSGWLLLFNYDIILMGLGVFMFFNTSHMVALFLFCLKHYLLPRFAVDTHDNLTITYSIKNDHSISGVIKRNAKPLPA